MAKEYHKNPRKITPELMKQLEENLKELGDLSGITHDLNSDEIITGNQRSKVIKLDECEVKIITENKKPDKQGTVALGYVIWNGMQMNYRQVRWNEAQREKANITANSITGLWDEDIIKGQWGNVDGLEEMKKLKCATWKGKNEIVEPSSFIDWKLVPACQTKMGIYYYWKGVGCQNKCGFCFTSWTKKPSGE